MRPIKISEDLRPMTDLKSHGAAIVRQVQGTGRPVVLTRHGRGVAVVVSLEDYEKLREAAEHIQLQQAVTEAWDQIDTGESVPHDEVRKRLQTWASGSTG